MSDIKWTYKHFGYYFEVAIYRFQDRSKMKEKLTTKNQYSSIYTFVDDKSFSLHFTVTLQRGTGTFGK